MPYPFCCPQGHVLQAELSSIGQLWQCPTCGTGFLVPAPDCGAKSPSTWQRPGEWPPLSAPSGLPVAIAVDVPPTGAESAAPSMSPTTPDLPRQPVMRSEPPSPDEKPAFELGFDPAAKAALPFDLPGESDGEEGDTETAPTIGLLSAGVTPGSFLAGPSAVSPVPVSTLEAPSLAASAPSPAPLSAAAFRSAPFEEVNAAGELLTDAPAVQKEAVDTAPPPRILHIRCPTGHVLKAPSELLGKNGRCPACKKTFELRYENSIEFRRRTEKILRREQNEAERVWMGWVFVAAFVFFVVIVGAVMMIGR